MRAGEPSARLSRGDYTPINAMHVPPPPDLVADLITDLLAFANRDDLPILAQPRSHMPSSNPSTRSPTATAASGGL